MFWFRFFSILDCIGVQNKSHCYHLISLWSSATFISDDIFFWKDAHRPRSLHIGKQISVIFSMVSIEGWNKSWAPILAGGKADRHCIILPCLLYSWRENAVSMISGHCERESMMKSCVFTSILGVGWHFFTWRCRWDLDEKSFSQYLHCFRGAPVWIIMCSFRYHFWEKVFLQSPHSCSAVSSWNLFTCLRKASVLLKVFPHSSHVSTLILPVWTLKGK